MKTGVPADVRARAAEERDLPRIHAIERASFPDPWSVDGFRQMLDQPHVRLEVAVDARGEVLGYAAALIVAGEAEIANLAVAAAQRRRGIGAYLLDRMLAVVVSGGAKTIYLEVRESNAAAKALYENRGFIVAGRRKAYYRKPVEDALVMRRAL